MGFVIFSVSFCGDFDIVFLFLYAAGDNKSSAFICKTGRVDNLFVVFGYGIDCNCRIGKLFMCLIADLLR